MKCIKSKVITISEENIESICSKINEFRGKAKLALGKIEDTTFLENNTGWDTEIYEAKIANSEWISDKRSIIIYTDKWPDRVAGDLVLIGQEIWITARGLFIKYKKDDNRVRAYLK